MIFLKKIRENSVSTRYLLRVLGAPLFFCYSKMGVTQTCIIPIGILWAKLTIEVF